MGLLIAVIFLAAWGSIAAALNALASCTVVDFHKRFVKKELSQKEDYRISKFYTFCWGIFCIYGVILGIFMVAFWFRSIKANALFYAALIAEVFVIAIYRADIISFLWLNAIGAVLVIVIGLLLQPLIKTKSKDGAALG